MHAHDSNPLMPSFLFSANSRTGDGWQRTHVGYHATYRRINGVLENSDATLRDFWKQMLALRDQGTGLLGHPDYIPPAGASTLIYQPPLYDTGTASYQDVRRILARIHDYHIKCLGQRIVLVVGDHQTYDRMLKLKINSTSNEYSWLVSLPGELHFKWHVTLALHRLWWKRLAGWFCATAGMIETINENSMEAADKIKYILDFYSRVCLAIITYLSKVFGAELRDVDAFLVAHADNLGACNPPHDTCE